MNELNKKWKNEWKNELKNEWKWSKGEVYYKSARKIKEEREEIQEREQREEININEINDSAIKQSIEGFHFVDPTFSRNESFNKREDLDNKISDRELLYQRGTNPYLGNNNYLKDITARDIFLKPKNTTIDN